MYSILPLTTMDKLDTTIVLLTGGHQRGERWGDG